ncbi:DUF4188 domain-containing protein [Streptomyces sp. VRA16 Mangrove soil]|nr:DUF4188 domain-containing protein [Streptomyces sp. VRA16 Mangrove soil]
MRRSGWSRRGSSSEDVSGQTPSPLRRARAGKGHVGIWHETFIVPSGSYGSVYVDLPAYGLGAATGVVPVGRRGGAAARRPSV